MMFHLFGSRIPQTPGGSGWNRPTCRPAETWSPSLGLPRETPGPAPHLHLHSSLTSSKWLPSPGPQLPQMEEEASGPDAPQSPIG